MCYHTLNNNACSVYPRDVHSSLWDGEPGSTGVPPSMTGIYGRESDERAYALLTR